MPKYKIAVGFVTGNGLLHEAVPVSLLQMMSGRDWTNYEFTEITKKGIYIEVNRNDVATDFMEQTDAEFLFFWDYDNGLFPDAFDLYMEDMKDPAVNILSALYFRKGDAMRTVCGISFPRMDAYVSDSVMFVGGGLLDLTTHAGSERGMLGAGCLMIRREVFDKLPYPWFETKLYKSKNLQERWGLMTEDVYFCELAQEHGYHVHVDTRIRSPHYAGDLCFPEEWRQYDHEKEDDSTITVGLVTPDYNKVLTELDIVSPPAKVV